MEKKLTDEEIVKALEKCRERPYCEVKCEYKLARTGAECIPKLMGIALDLINRQKAEIERLTEENEYLDGCAKQFLADYQKCEVEVAEIQKQAEAWKARAKELEQAWEVSSSNEEKLQKQVDKLKTFIDFKTANVMCDKCKEQAVKDTAKEILQIIKEEYGYIGNLEKIIAERYGVEVE